MTNLRDIFIPVIGSKYCNVNLSFLDDSRNRFCEYPMVTQLYDVRCGIYPLVN